MDDAVNTVMSDWKKKEARRQQDWVDKETLLLSGSGHKLHSLPKDANKLKLNDETGISQAILEYAAANFLCLEDLDISIEYSDNAPKLSFQLLSFPKLQNLSLKCVGLTEINFQKDLYPCLERISLDNIVGEVNSFRLDLPTLKSFSAQFVTLNSADEFAASLSRCTNLECMSGYKLWGLSSSTSKKKLYLPNCEDLDLYRSDDLDYLDIYAPKLTKLNLQACYSLNHVRLVDEPFGRPVACFNCKKVEGDDIALSKCAKCQIAQYCSKECQTKHWDEHKSNCGKKILVNIVNANIDKVSMKHLRSHPRVKKIFKDDDDPMGFLMA